MPSGIANALFFSMRIAHIVCNTLLMDGVWHLSLLTFLFILDVTNNRRITHVNPLLCEHGITNIGL